VFGWLAFGLHIKLTNVRKGSEGGGKMEWKGKTALITGGVSGIGFGIARAFSAAGIDLILTYRNEDYRAEAEAWFKLHARPIPRFIALDVTDRGRWAEIAVEAGPPFISSSTTPE
jgi:NADP-dependent 3-hydroxy acid dehydrogenase YdfG